jgi:CheY-like chemotaxis protein
MSQRILIAEDDELQGLVLQTGLKRRGHEAELVNNGLEAVRRLRTGHYDLGLLDYAMPEVNGLAAARLLRDFFCQAECPRLIAVTSAADEVNERSQGFLGRGFDAIVSKQIGLQGMLILLDAQLASLEKSKAATVAALERTRVPVTVNRDHNTRVTIRAATEAGRIFLPAGKSLTALDDPFGLPGRSDGQVQAISLAAFKVAVGPDWPRVALRAMMKAEQILKRRLIAGDVMSRSGDDSFLIWFNSTNAQHNEGVLTAVTREIRVRLLTDFGEDAPATVCKSSAAVRQYLPAHDEE